MFSVHTTPKEFEDAEQSPVILDLCLRRTYSGKSHDFRDAIALKKDPFSKCFSSTRKQKASIFKFVRPVKSVFEKLHFLDGLVWTAGLTVEVKLRFQISLAWCGPGLSVGTLTVTTEICTVYTHSNVFRQILPFSVKLLFLKQTELHGMCQFTESGKTYI